MNVIKRDGTIVPFDFNKIKSAVNKAFNAVHNCDAPDDFINYLDAITSIFDCDKSVEDIQKIVIYSLGEFKYYDVQIAYIKYKDRHDSVRNWVEDKKDFINQYKTSFNTADSTIDDNSNVSGKNVGILNAEIHKPDNIQISRRMIMDKLKELYPDFDSKQYVRDLEHHIIYKHDESSFAGAIAPYCCSISMYPFLTDGIKNLGGLSAAPKNLDSFCGMYINLIFATASMFAGAVATSEFLLYFDYFARKEFGDDYYLNPDLIISQNTSRHKSIRNQIHQYFQQVIYSINQPAASRGQQSAFVNFSYFDKPFFEGMFGDFYFPDNTQAKWESVCWLQKEFMQWFNKERLRCILTFPVESVTLLYKDGGFADEDMFNFVCEEYARGHSFFTYISDTVDSLSSCCFSGKEKIWIIENEQDLVVSDFETAYNKYGQSIIKTYQTDPYTKESKIVNAEIIKTTTKEWITFNCKVDATLSPEKSIEWYKHSFVSIKVTPNHILPILRDDKVLDLKAKDITEDDLLLFDARCWQYKPRYKKDRIFTGFVCNIKKEQLDTEEDCYCFNITEDSSPYFNLFNGLITHNCRLKNKIQTKEFNFTNGNMGVMTGSKSVITLNLNRIVQDWYNDRFNNPITIKESLNIFHSEFPNYLKDILERVYRYHTAYNEQLYDMYDAGLLPVYKAGFINLDKQYLTIGLNGLNQAAESLGIECNDNKDYKDFCQLIFSTVKEQNTLHKTKRTTYNTEMVPAESLAVKNYNWDKQDGYRVPEDTNLYASYIFKPNDTEISVLDKLKLHGSEYIGDYLDGGSAAHINLDSHLSAEQYRKLIKYAASVGCQYFTWNIPNSECQDCGWIGKQPVTKCPKCGSEHIDYYDRVIGYLTKVKNWSDGRRIEQKNRVYTKVENIEC